MSRMSLSLKQSNSLSKRGTETVWINAASSRFFEDRVPKTAEAALVGRLEELLVLELCRDGSKTYLSLSVRGLYKHVISCITNPPRLASIAISDSKIIEGEENSAEKDSRIEKDMARRLSPQMEEVPTPNTDNTKNSVLVPGTEAKLMSAILANEYSRPPNASLELSLLPPLLPNLQKSSELSRTNTEPPEIPRPVSYGGATSSQRRRRGRNVSVAGLILEEVTSPVSNAARNRSGSDSRSAQSASQQHHVTYRERLGAYIHPRDMRRLVTPFSASNEPELIVRRHVMLLNFDPLRAIVLRDRLLVLVPEGADSLLVTLEQRIRGVMDDVENSIFGSVDDSSCENDDNDEDVIVKPEPNELSNNNNLEWFLPQDGEVNLNGHKVDATNNKVSDRKLDENTLTTTSTGYSNLFKSIDHTFFSKMMGFRRNDSDVALRAQLNVSNGSKKILSDSATSNKTSTGILRTATAFGPKKKNDRGVTIVTSKESHGENFSLQRNDAGSNSTLDEDDEFNEIEGREWINLPFELQCVDAVLFVVGSILTEETSELQNVAIDCIHKLLVQDSNGLNYEDPLTIVRSIKDCGRELTSRVKGFVQSMNRILDEDEDMALMNLSRLLTHPTRFIQPVPQEVLEEESDEPELLLEANLQIVLTLLNALDLIKGQIDTASELVDQKLDALRNRLLFANAVISLLSLCVAAAALVGSLLGMNLDNHMEDDPNAFRQVTFGTIGGCIAMAIIAVLILVYSGTIPKTSFKRPKYFGTTK